MYSLSRRGLVDTREYGRLVVSLIHSRLCSSLLKGSTIQISGIQYDATIKVDDDGGEGVYTVDE